MPQGEVFCIRNIVVVVFVILVVVDVVENIHNLQCVFLKVDFRIVYDDDVYGARIIAEGPSAEGDDEYNVVCNHLIGNILNYYVCTGDTKSKSYSY